MDCGAGEKTWRAKREEEECRAAENCEYILFISYFWTFFSLLLLLLSFALKVKMLRRVPDNCLQLCPSHSGCLDVRCCCISPGLGVHVLCAARATLPGSRCD